MSGGEPVAPGSESRADLWIGLDLALPGNIQHACNGTYGFVQFSDKDVGTAKQSELRPHGRFRERANSHGSTASPQYKPYSQCPCPWNQMKSMPFEIAAPAK